jgi:hypothetical protein
MNTKVFKEVINGARNLKVFLISSILLIAGLSFLLVGLSSYFQQKLFFFTSPNNIIFIPQGIVMIFYGSLAIIISCYLFLTFILNLGSGYNEFSQEEKVIRLIRLGFPGKNRELYFSYNLNKITKLKLLIKNGLNPRSNILLVLKDNREIPLYPAHIFLNIFETEKKALYLSNFLNLPLDSSFI